MIKSCLFSKKLSLLIDGELTQDQADQVRRHIQTCGLCQDELSRLQSIGCMVAGLTKIDPSAQFEQQFWKKIKSLKDQKEQKKRPWSFEGIAAWGLRPSLAAAAVAVLIVSAGVMIYFKSSPPQLNSEDLSISENLEFYSDFDVVSQLDLLENWDEIMTVNGQS